MWTVVITLVILIISTQGLEVVFEKIEQLSGFDVFENAIRVRKYNRTTVTANGTFIVKLPLDNTFISVSNLYHSPLGNQQWNHYPMKLPSKGYCEFLYSVYDDYYQYIKDIVNLPKKGECPITPRELHMFDMVFPSKAIPPVLPKGLWKAIMTTKNGNIERTRIDLILKAYADDFF